MDHQAEELSLPAVNTNLLYLAIIMGVLNNFNSVILKYTSILKNMFTQTSQRQELKNKLLELQKESAQIDMTDEFAKYARLQRKIIKIQDELKKEVSAQKVVDMKNKMILRVVLGLVSVGMMFSYNSHPVVQLDPEWLYPVSSLLSWPGGQDGTISFLVWCAISNSVLRTFS